LPRRAPCGNLPENKPVMEETMTKLQMRRRTMLAAAPIVLAAPHVARAQAKPEKSKVILAVGGKSALYYLSLTIAERKGFFKEAGIDVEINDFQGGAKSLQALMGGSADVVAGAYEHTIRMQQRGQDVTGFALIGRGMQICIALRNDVAARVKGPADIKGMKFGVTAPGSSTHMLLNFWAAKGGLKASDVVAIGVGAGASVIAAVEKGEVDGVSQTDPALTILTNKNLVKVVVDTRTTKGNQEVFGGAFPAGSLYSQSDFIKKNPGTTQSLATGIVRANQWLQTASPADVASAVPEGYLLGDRAIYEKSFAGVRETISPDGTMPAGAMENCLKFLAESDPAIKPATVKLADTWNNEFAQRAAKRS